MMKCLNYYFIYQLIDLKIMKYNIIGSEVTNNNITIFYVPGWS
jgi:hypothetical protein